MRFPLYYLFLLVYITSSGQESEVDLNDYFSKTEVKDLNLITDFFQNELCGTKASSKFAECIKKSIPDLIDLEQNYIGQKVNYRKQKKMYTQISDSTFNKIWGICKSWVGRDMDYEYQSLCYNRDKVFINFIEALGKTNPYIEYQSRALQNVGSFVTGNYLISNIKYYPQNWNLHDRGTQIFIAIHYLTVNDQEKRNKKATRLINRHSKKGER